MNSVMNAHMSHDMKLRINSMTIRMTKIVFLFFLTSVVLVFSGQFFVSAGVASEEKYITYADEIVSRCSSSQYKPSCYDKEIPKLLGSLTMENAFLVTKYVQERDNSYGYCHVLGHELAANETKKNPAAWKEVINRCPSGICSNGCIHGAFQERFRTDRAGNDEELTRIKTELKDICETRENWNPTGMEQGSCYHALGHLVMYITGADVRKSLPLCDELVVTGPDRDFAQLCYDGVFMQIFQPLEAEDFALIAGKEVTREKHKQFCDSFTGKARGSCWTEGWPVHLDEVHTPEGLASFCSYLDGKERDRCFRALTYVMVPQLKLDSEAVSAYCKGFPVLRQVSCYSDAAARMMEIDYRNTEKAAGLCDSAPSDDVKNGCYDELVKLSTYNYHSDSQEKSTLCLTLPEPWRARCEKKP